MQDYIQNLKYLWDLQQLDTEIMKLRKTKSNLPKKIEQMKQRLQETETQFQKQQEQLLNIHKQRREAELDLQTIEEKIKKLQTQLYEVKTNKEYNTMQHEIDEFKKRSGDLEEKILQLMEADEEFNDKQTERENAFQNEKQKLEKLKKDIEERLTAIDNNLKQLLFKRKKLVLALNDDSLIYRYERIRKARAGSAVVAIIRGNVCNGCFREFPPQTINEARLATKIITCDQCGRIVIWREESEY